MTKQKICLFCKSLQFNPGYGPNDGETGADWWVCCGKYEWEMSGETQDTKEGFVTQLSATCGEWEE